MEDNVKVVIVPDVHGRDFWKEPVMKALNETDARIVFLGDYLDPYKQDFDHNHYQETAIGVFVEILNLKKEYGKRITLLIGNHDCGYRFDLNLCDCRTDYGNFSRIKVLFDDNKDLFQLADEEYVNGKHFILSHAGIHKGYVRSAFPDEFESITESNVVDYFNNAYFTEDPKVINSLGMYDRHRGWLGFDYGSLVWADVHSWFEEFGDDGYAYNIFGHTQMEHGCGGLIEKNVACLDSSEVFCINELGEIKKFF